MEELKEEKEVEKMEELMEEKEELMEEKEDPVTTTTGVSRPQ